MSTPSPTGHTGPDGSDPTGIPIRPLAAWALLALAGTVIVFGFLTWIVPPFRVSFLDRFSGPDFTTLVVLAGPLLAVLIAARVTPVLSRATMIAQIALIEYAAALLFGSLAFLLTLADRFQVGDRSAFYAFGGVIQSFGGVIADLLRLGLMALAALWVYQMFTRMGGRLPRIQVRTR